jgi:predicted flap endonuclease-1-like 5' DNA nuclease
MKHSWIILELVLLLIAGVGLLVYLLTQGMVTNVPMLLLVWLLLFGIFALGGGIAWLAGWLPQKKKTTATLTPEPEPQSAVIETPKAEPGRVMVEEVKAVPMVEEVKTEPSQRPVKETMNHGFKIIDIEGIGPRYAKKLNSIDIYTASDLLEAGATPLGRKELEEKTGISHKLILEWVNISDLLRIKGVGEEYSDLLEEAGVDTVVELSKRVPENLHAKMLEVNEKKHLVRRPPSLNQVGQWIEEAKKLPRKVEY